MPGRDRYGEDRERSIGLRTIDQGLEQPSVDHLRVGGLRAGTS